MFTGVLLGGLLTMLPVVTRGQPPCDLEWKSSFPIVGYFMDMVPSGDIYVSDVPTQTISRYSSGGVLIHSWGNVEGNSWQLVRPFGLAVSADGRVYVADFDQDKVLIFDLEGAYLGSLGEPGAGPGQMDSPYDVALDSQGNVYVSDRGNGRVDKFSAAGEFLLSWGSPGFGPEKFANITCLVAGAGDEIFVADQSGYVRRYTSNGSFITRFDGTESGAQSIDTAIGIALTRDGSLLHVVDWDDSEITSFGIDGELYSRCGSIGHGEYRFFYPGDLDEFENDLMVFDAGNNRVVRLGQDAVPVQASTWSGIKSRFGTR